MDPVDLPLPVVRRASETIDVATLERDLRSRVDGEVRFDAGTRAAYSTDASNYRQVPIGVVIPRTVEAAEAAVAVCREHQAPLLSRGGGTSLARRVLQHRGRHRLEQILQSSAVGGCR